VNVPLRTSKSAELRWDRIALALFSSLETILAETNLVRVLSLQKTGITWLDRENIRLQTNPEEEVSDRFHHISVCDRLTR